MIINEQTTENNILSACMCSLPYVDEWDWLGLVNIVHISIGVTQVRGVATIQMKIAFLFSISIASLDVWRCVGTSLFWLYVVLVCVRLAYSVQIRS